MARHNKDCEKVLARRGHFTAAFFGQGYNGVRLLSGYWAVPGGGGGVWLLFGWVARTEYEIGSKRGPIWSSNTDGRRGKRKKKPTTERKPWVP